MRVFEKAANQLYTMCFEQIVKYLVSNGLDEDNAQAVFNEVVAETFIPSVIAGNYRHEGKILGFLKSICLNKSVDLNRKEKAVTNIIPLHDLTKKENDTDNGDSEESGTDSETEYWDIEDNNTTLAEGIVVETLDSLPLALDILGQSHPTHRDFLLKYWWQQQDLTQIGQELGIPAGQEAMFHQRAKEKLKKILVNLHKSTSIKNNPFDRVA
jgi:DNA-directed RNA polymerase specialized sigma24 family protein